MKYEICIDDVSREQWERCAKLFADYNIYQTWSYQEVRAEMARQSVSRAIVTDQTGNPITMCQVRIKNVKALRLRIGYVQWGPLLRRRDGSNACPVEALQMLRDTYVGSRVDVLRLVPNIWDDESGKIVWQTLVQSGFERVSRYKPYHTLLLSIEDSHEQIRKMFHRNFRSNLKKAEKSGLELRQGVEDEFRKVLEDLYLESVKRKSFRGLDPEEFTRVQKLLSPSEKMKFFVALKDGEPVSVLLVGALGDIAVALLAATNEKGLSCGASFLVWHQSILAMKKSGAKGLDCGGIDPVKNPSVYRFKSSMGGQEIFHIGAFEVYRNRRAKLIWRTCETVYNFIR